MAAPEETEQGPTREEIHLPAPTLVPLAAGVGLTVMLVGLILNWFIVGAGAVILVLALVRWIRDVRHDIGQLPR